MNYLSLNWTCGFSMSTNPKEENLAFCKYVPLADLSGKTVKLVTSPTLCHLIGGLS